MKSLRVALSVMAAFFIGVFGPGFVMAFRGSTNSKAIGLAVVVGSVLESLLTPWCWVLALSFFALFYFFARLNSRPLRILLFWIPATAISTLGVSIVGLFTYLWMRYGRT